MTLDNQLRAALAAIPLALFLIHLAMSQDTYGGNR